MDYNKLFYSYQEESLQSAEEIVPLILDLINPTSVVDVGCGTGTWLSVFKKYGVEKVLGIDGKWVDEKRLYINKREFLEKDFNFDLNFNLKDKFDICLCLEVAEHLKADKTDAFVDMLTKLSDIIIFSAAVPFQGGICHVNEQWPRYWEEKFSRKGYIGKDFFRKKIWQNKNVKYWYKQNMILFINKKYLEKDKRMRNKLKNADNILPLVHPEIYLEKAKPSLKRILRMVRGLL